jgi:hypothetical protein
MLALARSLACFTALLHRHASPLPLHMLVYSYSVVSLTCTLRYTPHMHARPQTHQGISRSATMMIAYLMAAKRLTLYQAFQLCYSKRRVVWPNRSFMQQLIEYEKKLQVSHGT